MEEQSPLEGVVQTILGELEQNKLLKERVCELARENSELRRALHRSVVTCFCSVDESCFCGGR